MDATSNRKNSSRWVLIVLIIAVVVVAVVFFRRPPTASVPRADADTSVIAPPPEPTPEVTADARRLLEQIRAAYQELKSAQFTGVVRSNVDADGEQQTSETTFTSSFGEPNRFRHEAKDDLTIGSTGEKIFVFNQAANEYLLLDAPQGGVDQLPHLVPEILRAQNPSLLLALLNDPNSALVAGFGKVDRAADIDIDGRKHPALVLAPREPEGNLTVVLDPDTHLLKQLRVDLKPAIEQRGAQDVKAAEAIVNYTATTTGVALAAEHFAWEPPPNAQDVTASRQPVQEASEAALVGKPAPEFQLATLDGKSVSLADLKGEVVVLDFWASWCPPCIESLPHLGELYQEKRDEGVKVFAVNLGEDKARIEAFLKAKNFAVPVLLDSNGEVAKKFNVTSIPQTVVIGKDGTVKKVLVGLGDDGFDAVRNEVQRQKEAS